MSKYNGPSPLIADGEALAAGFVSDEFSSLATSLNSVDKNNWPNSSKRFITNRSVHHDALTVPFLQNQLIEDEPATLLHPPTLGQLPIALEITRTTTR